MGRVCSMESKATLPVLVRRAGREWQRLNFAALGKGKTRGTFGKKSAWFAYLPTYLRYLLKESLRSPVLSTGTLQHQHQKFAAVQGTLPTFTYPGLITPQKRYHNSLNQKLLSARPTNLATHVVQKNTLPDLRHALCLLQSAHTHIHQIYPSSSTRTVHLVPPNSLKRHSRISSASVLPPRYGMGCPSSSSSFLFRTSRKRRKTASQTRRQTRRGTFANRGEESEQQQHHPISSHDPRYCLQFSSNPQPETKLKPIEASFCMQRVENENSYVREIYRFWWMDCRLSYYRIIVSSI